MTTFDCYKQINVLNPDGSINTGDISFFDYINLEAYGGLKFVKITSLSDVVTELAKLNIPSSIDNYNIFILDSRAVSSNINSSKNPKINFTYNGVNTILDFSEYTRFNLSFYNGNTIEFFYNSTNLLNRLNELLSIEVLLENNMFVLDKYEGLFQNIEIDKDPEISVLGTTCNNNVIDWNTINAVDYSYYGGEIKSTNYNQLLILNLNNLGLNAVIKGCKIRLIEYLGVPQDLPSCTKDFLEFSGASLNDFDEVDLTSLGGGIINVTGGVNELSTLLNNLGYQVFFPTPFVNATINFPLCTDTEVIPIRKYENITAQPIILPNCIKSGTDFLVNVTDPIVSNQDLIVTKINNQNILEGQTITVTAGLDVSLINNNIILKPSLTYVTNTIDLTFTVQNTDNQTSSSYIRFCVADQPVANPDTVTIDCNSTECVNTVIENDYSAYNGLQIISVNNINIIPDQIVTITPGLQVQLSTDGEDLCFITSNEFQGVGMVNYTVSNGVFTASSFIDYNAQICDPCIINNLTMEFNPTCATVCWTTLKSNNIPIANYKINLIKPDGSVLLKGDGTPFSIASGTYYDPLLDFLPNNCAPILANTYSILIVDSDIGSNLLCDSLSFTQQGMTCDETVCAPGYAGPGGPAAQLQFSIEILTDSVINLLLFNPASIPDGLVIEYNNQVVYHTGNTASEPYISGISNYSPTFSCGGMTYLCQQTADPQNINIPITYVPGQNSATVTIFGYPCNSANTAWTLSISCTP